MVMSTPLGEYLRGRRAAVRPEDAGFPENARRRVAGLRREEVAVAAGVSADYYVRIEQGREPNPSPQVLDALSRALHLDDDGRLHLFRLAGFQPAPVAAASTQRVDVELARLLDAWPDQPALVVNRAYDVLAANTLGRALHSHSPFGTNLARLVFLDPAAEAFYADWAAAADGTVAGLRLAQGAAPDDARLSAVIAELMQRSEQFRTRWSAGDARGKRLSHKTFAHPLVGAIAVRTHHFDVRSAPGQELVVYRAEPGSTSAQNLALLGALATPVVERS